MKGVKCTKVLQGYQGGGLLEDIREVRRYLLGGRESKKTDAMGGVGWKKEGGGKPHEGHPSQKGALDPPHTACFPPRVSLLCFSCTNPRLSRPEALLEGSRIFERARASVRLPPPTRFATPPPPIS